MKTLITLLFICVMTHSQPIIFWSEINSGLSTPLNSVSESSSSPFSSSLWVCGDNGVVLKSTNYGNNWVNVGINGIPNNLVINTIFTVDRNTALVAGYNGSNTFVFKTSNAGANWTQVFTQTGGFINSIWIVDFNQNGFMQGNPVNGRWSLWKTSNRGSTWDSAGLFLPQMSGETGSNNSFWFSNDRIWFGTNSSKIYYSTNHGGNWVSQSTSTENNINCIWFNSYSTVGFAGGSNLIKTINQGNNWLASGSLGSGNFSGVTGIPFNWTYIWYARSNNIVYLSTNNGTTWILNYTAPSGNFKHLTYTRNIGFTFDNVWGVRSNGGISRGQVLIPDGITLISSEIPESHALHTNYPNPFNPITNFVFEIPHKENVKIEIYDMLGKKVNTLTNKVLNAGKYKVTFNAEDLSSGIYFYELVSDKIRITKKMILIK